MTTNPLLPSAASPAPVGGAVLTNTTAVEEGQGGTARVRRPAPTTLTTTPLAAGASAHPGRGATSHGLRLVAVRSDVGVRYLGVALRLDADQAALRTAMRVLGRR